METPKDSAAGTIPNIFISKTKEIPWWMRNEKVRQSVNPRRKPYDDAAVTKLVDGVYTLVPAYKR